MKKIFSIYRLGFLLLLTGFLSLQTSAQQKKERLRLSTTSITTDDESAIQVLVRYKGENGYEGVPNLTLQFSQSVAEDSLVFLGESQTNTDGVAKFVIQDKKAHVPDSVYTYNYVVSFDGDDAFRSADDDITVSDLDMEVKWEVIDSLPYITAQLLDKKTGEAIASEPLKLRLKRLFRPLAIGGDMHFTDDDGKIEVEIPEGLPGENGNLTFEVVLDEHDTYGTVIKTVSSTSGVVPADASTFDQRELWSPASKTPIFMLIFPNLIIFGIWFVILLSFRNLLLIQKFNNNENS